MLTFDQLFIGVQSSSIEGISIGNVGLLGFIPTMSDDLLVDLFLKFG